MADEAYHAAAETAAPQEAIADAALAEPAISPAEALVKRLIAVKFAESEFQPPVSAVATDFMFTHVRFSDFRAETTANALCEGIEGVIDTFNIATPSVPKVEKIGDKKFAFQLSITNRLLATLIEKHTAQPAAFEAAFIAGPRKLKDVPLSEPFEPLKPRIPTPAATYAEEATQQVGVSGGIGGL